MVIWPRQARDSSILLQHLTPGEARWCQLFCLGVVEVNPLGDANSLAVHLFTVPNVIDWTDMNVRPALKKAGGAGWKGHNLNLIRSRHLLYWGIIVLIDFQLYNKPLVYMQ